MKEAIILLGPKARIIESPIPSPRPDEVVIKVVVSGSNPKDWKYVEWTGKETNQGDDIAGIVHAIGSNVVDFKPGDRVAAFHEMHSPHGSYAEYAVAWSYCTFHIPHKTSFEEAATIPLAAMTAAFGLYQYLSLPLPWNPTKSSLPLIIYGAATAVGSFAIKLAVQSDIHPLICVAGRGTSYVESLIDSSKGDVILDYREGNEKLVQKLKEVVAKAGGKVEYAFDTVSEHNSYENISQVLDPKSGQITLVLPAKEGGLPAGLKHSLTRVGDSFEALDTNSRQKQFGTLVGNQEFAYLFYRYFARGLDKGFFTPHPHQVVPGGLNGVQQGLKDLKDGKASAVKYVFRIAETEGVQQ